VKAGLLVQGQLTGQRQSGQGAGSRAGLEAGSTVVALFKADARRSLAYSGIEEAFYALNRRDGSAYEADDAAGGRHFIGYLFQKTRGASLTLVGSLAAVSAHMAAHLGSLLDNN
jgi:hypothetical protein